MPLEPEKSVVLFVQRPSAVLASWQLLQLSVLSAASARPLANDGNAASAEFGSAAAGRRRPSSPPRLAVADGVRPVEPA